MLPTNKAWVPEDNRLGLEFGRILVRQSVLEQQVGKGCPQDSGNGETSIESDPVAMYLIDKLAEEKIAEAIRRGELDDLPGAGKPLHLEDDSLVPETLRAGFRLLKNAGYLPPDLQLRKEIGSVEALLVQARSLEERDVLNRRLRYLLLQLGVAGPDTPLLTEQRYLDKLCGES